MTNNHANIKSGDFRETRLHEVLFIGGIICSQKVRMESLPWVITVAFEGFSTPVRSVYELLWCHPEKFDDERRAPLYVLRGFSDPEKSARVQAYLVDYSRPSRYWDEVEY